MKFILNVTQFDNQGNNVPDDCPEYNNPDFPVLADASALMWELINTELSMWAAIGGAKIQPTLPAPDSCTERWTVNYDEGFTVYTITANDDECIHPGVFSSSDDPDATVYCPTCKSNVPNYDL